MAKIQQIASSDEIATDGAFYCPGCEGVHVIRLAGPKAWQWNGKLDKPTFSPSYLAGKGTDRVCHSFITDGKIQFLGDCHHALKGQTVELPEWPGWPE